MERGRRTSQQGYKGYKGYGSHPILKSLYILYKERIKFLREGRNNTPYTPYTPFLGQRLQSPFISITGILRRHYHLVIVEDLASKRPQPVAEFARFDGSTLPGPFHQ